MIAVYAKARRVPAAFALLAASSLSAIAEDESSLLGLMVHILEPLGYKVLQAENGAEALRTSREYEGTIDLLVTDVIMPEMNGKEFVQKVNKFLQGVKVLYVSGYTFEHLVKDGEIKDGINFLQKPYKIQKLLKKIREILNDQN